MESLFCIAAMITIVGIVIFIYLQNTIKKGTPPGSRKYAPVYVSIADRPEAVIQGMDKLIADVQRTESTGDRWRWTPLAIFLAGLGLMAIDGFLFLLGYKSFVFISGGIALWLAALILAYKLRQSDLYDFAPRYNSTRQVLHTLRDDLKPESTFLGHLDLTGALLDAKVAHETKDSQERTTQYFRDEWLALKAKLYDGNILRVSAVQKSKKRKSYFKRSSISGKLKVKPEKLKGSEQYLKVRIAVNPELYQIVPNQEFRHGVSVGKYTIAQLNTEGGVIDVTAYTHFDEIEGEHILNVLRSAYSLLQRKAA